MEKENSIEQSEAKRPRFDFTINDETHDNELGRNSNNNHLDSFDSNVTEEYVFGESVSEEENEISAENQSLLQREDTYPLTNPTDDSNDACKDVSFPISHTCTIKSFENPVKRIESVYNDAKFIESIISDLNIDIIYNKLEEKRQEKNRIDLVTNEILENFDKFKQENNLNLPTCISKQNSATTVIEDFVKVIDKVMDNIQTLPVSADEIRRILSTEKSNENRVDRVVAFILRLHFKPSCSYRVEASLDQNGSGLKKEDSLPGDPMLRNDPVFRDMHIIRKILPRKEPNEIYAFLEAHYHEKNRIRLVIEELIKSNGDECFEPVMQKDNKMHSKVENTQQPSLKSQLNNGVTIESAFSNQRETWTIKEEVEELSQIFPDCDPNFLFFKLEEKEGDKERVKKIATTLLDSKDYPKIKIDIEKKPRGKQIESFHVELFLQRFPDPAQVFGNKNRITTELYRDCVKAQLYNDFALLKDKYLNDVMKDNNNNYTLCRQAISTYMTGTDDFSMNIYRKRPRDTLILPENVDDYFVYEMQYNENELEILEFIENKKMLKEIRLEEARANNELVECGCCFDDECLFEDMAACSEGHIFCKECIHRSSDVVIGEGKSEFPCLGGECPGKFPLMVLQNVLSSNMYSILLKRMQEEEIKEADIEDLVCCPFCSFATIMPNPDDKVLKCLNPECLKDSCRLCKEPNHVPLRCNEIEKQGETSMRAYIENKVSEAMLRTCHVCKKRFFKVEGCNKMTCTCGATQCYMCRETDIDYSHFDNNERCQLTDDPNTIHVQDMEEAIKSAREQYLKDHPEAEDVVLKYDPMKHIEDLRNGMNQGYDDYDEDYYD